MIPPSMMQHTGKVWRSSEAVEATLSVVERTWAAVSGSESVRMGLQTRAESVDDPGPGEKGAGLYRGYCQRGVDIAQNDVVEILAGPNDPGLLRVELVYKPQGHHTQLDLSAWDGEVE